MELSSIWPLSAATLFHRHPESLTGILSACVTCQPPDCMFRHCWLRSPYCQLIERTSHQRRVEFPFVASIAASLLVHAIGNIVTVQISVRLPRTPRPPDVNWRRRCFVAIVTVFKNILALESYTKMRSQDRLICCKSIQYLPIFKPLWARFELCNYAR